METDGRMDGDLQKVASFWHLLLSLLEWWVDHQIISALGQEAPEMFSLLRHGFVWLSHTMKMWQQEAGTVGGSAGREWGKLGSGGGFRAICWKDWLLVNRELLSIYNVPSLVPGPGDTRETRGDTFTALMVGVWFSGYSMPKEWSFEEDGREREHCVHKLQVGFFHLDFHLIPPAFIIDRLLQTGFVQDTRDTVMIKPHFQHL